MTLTKKLTTAILLFKGLVDCFTITNHNEFHRLRIECIADGVDSKEFDELMNTVFNK